MPPKRAHVCVWIYVSGGRGRSVGLPTLLLPPSLLPLFSEAAPSSRLTKPTQAARERADPRRREGEAGREESSGEPGASTHLSFLKFLSLPL